MDSCKKSLLVTDPNVSSDLSERLKIIIDLSESKLFREKHIKFCLRTLGVLPETCHFLDSTRVVIAFFAISALDLLDALSNIEHEKKELIDWIYYMQVVPTDNETEEIDYGFRGSTVCVAGEDINSDTCDKANICMTYAALATLLILGDDLSRVRKKDILGSLRHLQLPNGSFRPMNCECENDMRFVYCACCICYILQDWSTIDVQKMLEYIKNSRNYDGGIGQAPGLESHGGPTYCAIASLCLMNKLESTFTAQELKELKRWLVFRQNVGFHGRPNKQEDTCYTFWIGATLKLLDSYSFVNYPKVTKFVLSTQDPIVGGIPKLHSLNSDILHTYLGISGLFLYDNKVSPRVHPALNISQRATQFLWQLHEQWNRDS